ncbi:hypothetical protein [Thiomicrorhabdus arctica]|jgi:hypothetical protein|uniref:hypothetical protein n=1 Tax=Thiomicrorhabdus arctica TaxID=131540 RepID=UPI00037C1D4F|nr:hypothetical protein [Thiomicrorhabdus arctica]
MSYAIKRGLIFCGLDECQLVKGIVILTVSFAVLILGGTWLSSGLLGYDYFAIMSDIALLVGIASAFPLAYASLVILKLKTR